MKLRTRLQDSKILIAPGIFDALGIMLLENAGFEVAYLSGASLAYTHHGRPDIGLVTMTEVAESVRLIRERSETPLIVDADTGYGNVLNTQRAVKLFERCGASAIQLEDQSFPKRCGHLHDKSVISIQEMAGKLKAALDARSSSETLIIARTDAVACEGFDSALDRAETYAETGIDILFVEALSSTGQMRLVNERFREKLPLMANMVEGGKTPLLSGPELQEIGYSLVIFPGGYVRAITKLGQRYFESLKSHETTVPFLEEMLDFEQLQDLLGTHQLLSQAKEYE